MNFILSSSLILREEPQYHNSYVLFDRDKCETKFLSKEEYDVLCLFSGTGSSIENAVSNERKNLKIRDIIDNNIRYGYIVPCNNETVVTNLRKKYSSGTFGKVPVLSFPTIADIIVTRKCNLRCVHCNMSAGAQINNELTFNEWKKIFDQLEENGIFKIQISGGEPLCHRHIEDIINYVGSKKYRVSMLTNGTLIDKHIAILLSSNMVSVSISIDGSTSDAHDTFRGTNNSFFSTMEAIKLVNIYGIICTVSTTIHKKNKNQIREIFDICKNNNIYMLQFNFIDAIGRGASANKWTLSPVEKQEVYRIFDEIKNNYNGSMKLFINNPYDLLKAGDHEKRSVICKAGVYSMTIDADGDMYPCVIGAQIRKKRIGNVIENSILELWRSNKEWGVFRGDITLDDLKVCSKCKYSSLCTMKKCRMRSILSGDVAGEPYKCPIKEIGQ